MFISVTDIVQCMTITLTITWKIVPQPDAFASASVLDAWGSILG